MSTTGNPFGMSNTRAQAAAQLPNFAQLFTADPTYKNFRSLNQQFTQIANAFGQGNSPFSLQDIQEGASAFQQAVNPYAQQFSEQSNREALALRMAEQQQLAAQGQGAPMQQAAFAQPAYSPAFPSSFPQQSPYSNFYGSPQLQSAINSRYGGGNQNVIPLEGRFGLVRLAGGGEVSEARRMLQNLQNANEVQAGQMINRFAGGGYAAGRFNRAMVEPDAITGRGDRNLFELFDRNDRAMIAPVGPNEDGGFGPPAYTAPEPAPIAEPLPPPVAEPLPPPVAEPLPPPVAEPQLQKDGFLPLLRPVLPPAPVEQVQRLIQEGRVPSNYVTGPYDAQGLSDEDMTRWIAGTYEPGGANAPGALPYIFAPDYVDPLQKASEQAQENALRAYQAVLDKRAAEQAPSPPPVAEPLPPPVAEPLPPPVAEPLPPPVAEPLPPPVAEPTPEPPPVAEPPGGIVTLPERPPVAELPRISPPEPPPAIPEPPPPITLPEIKERPVEPIKVPKVDEEFRSSPVRSFDPVTGSFRYTPPTKLDSATGAGTTWTPPTITSRKRQLLNVDYLPGIDVPQYDPLTNQLYQPALSASQRFAGDRNMQMAALQQLKTASPMSSATYLALQSRLRAGEFGGIGGQPVDMERLKAAATAMVPPVLGLKIGSLSDTAGGSQGSNVPAGFGSGVPVTLGVPTIGRKDGGEVSTEDFIKKQSGGDVSRGTSEVPQLDAEGRLIDEREEIRSESQRMLNRLQSQPSKLPPGLRRIVAATKAQGTESMFPAAAPARDLLSGIIGASPTAPGSEAYRTGQALANMPPVQAAAAIPAKIAASAGDAATALAAMGPAMAGIVRPPGGYFPTSRVPGKSLSNLDMALEQAISKIQASPDDEKKQALLTLFNQKAKDFFTKQAGSIDDPLRQEILSGRIRFEEGTRMADLFPNQLQKGAAKGDLQSLRLLDKNYDQMLSIKTIVPRRESTQPSPENVKRQIVQHIKDNLDQIPDAQLLAYAGRKPLPGPVGVAQSAAKVRQSLKDNPGLIETYLVPRIEKTLSLNPTQVTDLEMAKHPSLYAPRAVEQLRSPGFVRPDPKDPNRTDLTKGYFLPEVEQAIEKNQPIYDISSPHFYSLLGMTPDDLLKQARKLPQKELERISFPQFVKKAYALTQEANERQRLLQQVPQLIKEGKAPPEQIMLAGTKTFLPTSDGFKWIKVTDPDATVAIAKGMSNSVGGYATSTTYGTLNRGRTALERGEAEIYSLYDKNNIPHMTVEYLTNKAVPPEGRTDEAIKNTIAQFTGNGPLTANDKPGPMYVPHIRTLVDRLNPTRVPDTIRQLLKNN